MEGYLPLWFKKPCFEINPKADQCNKKTDFFVQNLKHPSLVEIQRERERVGETNREVRGRGGESGKMW